MKNFLFHAVMLSTIQFIATSCSEESKFKSFAVDFAQAVNSDDTIKIDSMLAYPKSFQYNKISLVKINPDSLKVIELGEGKYQITFLDDASMIVAKNGEDMQVEQTKKIFKSEQESVSFALKHNFIKNDDDDKTIYDAIQSEEYTKAKIAEQEELKFAKEKEAAQQVINKRLAEFRELVNTMQDLYDMDPGSLWWSMNQTVLTSAENSKRSLNLQRRYMDPQQLSAFQMLVNQYNRLIN